MRPIATALALTSSFFLGGCEALTQLTGDLINQLEKPSASISGVSFQDFSLADVTMLFDVDVENPYTAALPLADLTYGLSSGGQNLLSGAADISGTIPASGSRTLQVPAKVTFQSLLDLLSNVRPGSLVPYEANLGLSLDNPMGGDAINLPVSHQGELPIPTIPDVSVGGIRVEDLSLSNANLVLDLDVGNTNEFALDLLGFDYGFSLAGAKVASSTLKKGASFEPGGSNRLEIPLSFSPKNLGLAVFNVLSGKGADYSLIGNMEADTPFGRIDLPINSAGNAPLVR